MNTEKKPITKEAPKASVSKVSNKESVKKNIGAEENTKVPEDSVKVKKNVNAIF